MIDTLYPLYHENGELWSLISPLESYRMEMDPWADLISAHFPGEGKLGVLDLGTGGGHHLYHIDRRFPGRLTGVAVDRSSVMLERAHELLPSFETRVGDMKSVELGHKFPLVTVHDAFCYLTSINELEELATNVSRHLAPGGLALVKLEALAGQFKGPYRYLTTFEDEEQEVTLTHYEWDPDPDDTEIEVIYNFLRRRGGSVTSWEERHKLGIFTYQQLEYAWAKVGLRLCLQELERWDEDRPNLLLALNWAREGQTVDRRNFKSL